MNVVLAPIATKRGNVPTQNWSGKSAVFLMESALTSYGSNKSNKKNLGLIKPLSGLWSQDGHILFRSFGFGLLAPKDFTVIWLINYARI